MSQTHLVSIDTRGDAERHRLLELALTRLGATMLQRSVWLVDFEQASEELLELLQDVVGPRDAILVCQVQDLVAQSPAGYLGHR